MQHAITPVKASLPSEILEVAKRVHEKNSKKSKSVSQKLEEAILDNEKMKEVFETLSETNDWLPLNPSLINDGKNMKLWAFIAHGLVSERKAPKLVKVLLEMRTPAHNFHVQSKEIVLELTLAK